MKKLNSSQKWGIFFIAPWAIMFLVFLAYPIYLSLKNSFLKINLIQPEKTMFVGFENWIRALTDLLFWQSIFNIFYNQIIFIILSMAIGLLLASILIEIKYAKSFFRTVYFLPVITSLPVAMVIFSYLVNPTGPIQMVLMKWHILTNPIIWTFDKWLPMPIIALFSCWKWFGIQMIIFMAGMAGIDRSVYEAADIDGATWFDKFKKITIPSLKPQIIFVLSMNIINGLQMFTEVFMNFDISGGPYHSALTPVLYLFNQGFYNMDMGYASALGLLLSVIIFILTKAQMRIMRAYED
ncbi:MAG: sugar ABC transporter permease [Lentisphaerota bacterium]